MLASSSTISRCAKFEGSADDVGQTIGFCRLSSGGGTDDRFLSSVVGPRDQISESPSTEARQTTKGDGLSHKLRRDRPPKATVCPTYRSNTMPALGSIGNILSKVMFAWKVLEL